MNLLKNNRVRAFLWVILVYVNITILFALLYLIFDMTSLGFIVDHYQRTPEHEAVFNIWKMIYFSFITMAAVGYGDITPVGFSQIAATLQSFVGYILPLTLVVIFSTQKNSEELP
ncbi:ion channel [Thalassobacillus sp. C254]|uniref:ion channel n=1 Tax=Thalassobacillus sp. C254 TaxID=1225341 RepID=UPI0006D03C72|nr:ion channel [Thalassobacillus sp. C254]